MSIEQSLERIATSLEKQSELWERSLQLQENPLQRLDPEQVIQDPVIEELAGAEAPDSVIDGVVPDTVAPGPAGLKWNPCVEPIQSRYASAEKQQAIATCIAHFGIEVAPSWTFPKRHQAILDHCAAATEPNELLQDLPMEEVSELPAGETTWDLFKHVFMGEVERVGAASCKQVVKDVTGQEDVNEITCGGCFDRILELVAQIPDPVAQTSDPVAQTSDPAQYAPSRGGLLDYAKALTGRGFPVPDIQAAISHIAPGITQVPEANCAEAIKALQALEAAGVKKG